MKVVTAYPPNIIQIQEKFLVNDRTVYAWGDKIFNPSGTRLSKDMLIHEGIHQRQQKAFGGPEKWWIEYLTNPVFLLSQEVEAYGAQYRYICSVNHNRNFQFQVLMQLGLFLAGPMYGHCTNLETAMKLIKDHAR